MNNTNEPRCRGCGRDVPLDDNRRCQDCTRLPRTRLPDIRQTTFGVVYILDDGRKYLATKDGWRKLEDDLVFTLTEGE